MRKPGAMLRSLLTAAAMSLALAACVSPQHLTCKPGEQLAVLDTLYFGTMRARGPVTPHDWSRFLQISVNPRFPKGFTVSQASGQWRGADGAIVHESTYVLSVI